MVADSVMEQIARGTTEIIGRDELAARLKEGRALRIKAGFDPTASDIHFGHVVLLRKLRQFQDAGHQVYFLIGDFTAQIGDPTGKDRLRTRMDPKTIAANAATYKKQVFQVLDPKRTTVVFNSRWLGRLTAQDLLELTAQSTVAQMLARADFKKRFEDQQEISLLEFIYPLLQGYDSVELKADVEVGGSDQKFNLLMGRQLQEAWGQPPQAVVMTPLLEGLDGVKKMSKSLNNYIGIQEPPQEIFGKVMSISDEGMWRYYEVLTDRDLASVRGMHPKEAKLQLAQDLVALVYTEDEGRKARAEFERIFSEHQVPEDLAQFVCREGVGLVDILVDSKTVGSRNEARRLLAQGAVTFEGQRIMGSWRPEAGILKVGKRRFLKIVLTA